MESCTISIKSYAISFKIVQWNNFQFLFEEDGGIKILKESGNMPKLVSDSTYLIVFVLRKYHFTTDNSLPGCLGIIVTCAWCGGKKTSQKKASQKKICRKRPQQIRRPHINFM